LTGVTIGFTAASSVVHPHHRGVPLGTYDPSLRAQFLASRPWANRWWRPAPGEAKTLFWIALIHVTAAIGLFVAPVPSWPIALTALVLTWLGGFGTTVCYHRSLAHRAVQLHPWVRHILTFFAVLNGSGTPSGWSANHRLHHAHSDTVDDVSSPRIGGFWWAHLRWIWQAGQAPVSRYCPDLDRPQYRIWDRLQLPVMTLSFLGGLAFGWEGFFWLGSIRLVFALHAQCFVNSVCHMAPGSAPGTDSSRNVAWLGAWHLLQGENWHRNHHAAPWCARLGLTPMQIDTGWMLILLLERLGLAKDIKRPREQPVPAVAAAAAGGSSGG
jgi:stearoyl-CoA desaturase (delta-9 desaturase)